MEHPPRLPLAGLLACFLLLSSSTVANKCNTGCHGTNPSRAYQEGHTYTYQLEGTSVSSVSEAQGEASLKLSAIVELAVKPQCTRQLRLKNVQINGAPAPLRDIEQHALQFNYHDGHIDTEVCAETGDSQAALNIKRAVISLFQSAVIQDEGGTTHHETDVFGGCPTDFSFHKEGESLVVRKYRNLGQCSYRENIKQDLISSSFNINSDIKTSPLLGSEHTVEQHFKRGVLNKAVSTETYVFKPFSNGAAGAKTVVETVLTLKGQKGDSPTAPVSEPKSLIFDVPHPVVSSSVDAIAKALNVAHGAMPDDVTPWAARRFVELIKVLRVSSKDDILTVYSRVKAGAGFKKETHMKVFLDALFRTGTGEAAEVAVELIRNREINGVESLLYYTSLAFVRHASLASVTSVTSLLDQPNLPRIGYLGIGSLIGKYCQAHNCENVPQVKAALGKIASKVGTGRADTREQEDVILSSLKSLGNARYLDDATLQRIARVAADKNVHNRVRVSALDALPTMCSLKWKNIVIPVLADREEDSEIRIKAYLALVACPCTHVATALKEVLDKETVNQVGSFITSHLRNLRASADPTKQEAKRQLGLIKPRTKFPEDFRKFSFNNELSYSIDAFGFGSSAESNVIYSQNSFIPRSASLNLTTEIFGHNFNFLELDGRVENLDRLIEHYFGPKGFINTQDLKNVIVDGKKTFSDFTQHIEERFKKTTRGRRHVSQSELDNFGRKVHLRNNELDEELDLDLSIKLFGAELAFLSYQGASQQWSPDLIIDKIFDTLDEGISKAKHFNYHLKNHLLFLDAELVYPTGLGFPLSLGVTGSSAVHLKTSGKIDIPAILRNPKNSAVQIAVEPSASVRIAGRMVVEAHGIESGLKVITTLHTSTASDVSVKILEGHGIDINFGIPKQKQEIISITSEVVVSSGPKGQDYIPLKFSKGKETADCFDQLSGLIGLTVCGQVSFPYDSLASIQKKPIFPLSGPAKFAVTIESNDVKNYHFKAFYNANNPKARSLEILLETPNSNTNRRLSLLIEGAVEPDHLIRVSLDTPFKKASIEGFIKNNAQEHTVTINVKNDAIQYFIRAGARAKGNKYTPILEYKVPEHIEKLAGVKAGTKTAHRGGQQYNVGGVMEVANQNGGKKYVFDSVTLLVGGRQLVILDGTVIVQPNGISTDVKIGYEGESLAVKGDAQKLGELNYKLGVAVVPSKNPDLGFNIKWEYNRDKTHIENNLILVHGRDLNSEEKRITLNQYVNYKYVSLQNFDLSGKNKLSYPALGLIVKLEGAATHKSVSYDLAFKYDKFKLESELSAKTGISKPGDYEIEFETKFLENSIELKSKRTILGEHKSKFENSLELHPGGKYELDGVVVHEYKPNNLNIQLDAELKVNNKKVKVDTGLEATAQKVDSHVVIDADNVKYVDFLLKLQRGNNPNGNLKVVFKNYLTANGEFKYHSGVGSAHIDIDIPKVNRKINGNGELSVTGSVHVASIEVLYDASRDQSKRIKLSTNTDITRSSIDTKNVFEVLSYKTEVNVKGQIQGKLDDGRLNGQFDLTLPNGRYIDGKLERVVTRMDKPFEGQIEFELTDHVTKGGQSRKIIYSLQGHNVNIKAMTFQSSQSLKFVNFDGNDVQLTAAIKNLPAEGDKKSGEIKLNVAGSLIPKPLSLQVSSDYGLDTSAWKIGSTVGNDLSLQGSGNFARGNNVDRPRSLDTIIELKLPSDKVRNIKLDISEKLLIPKEVGGLFEYTVANSITYNDDKSIKVDAHIRNNGITDLEHTADGSAKFTVAISNKPPLTVGAVYKHNPLAELKKGSGSLNVNYGGKEATFSFDNIYTIDLTTFDTTIKATTPVQNLRNVNLHLTHKREKDGIVKNDVVVTADNVKYTVISAIHISQISPSLHFVITCPSGKTELLTKLNKISEKEFSGEFKFDSTKGFVIADGHANLDNIDNFVITLNFDSDKMKQRKIHAEIANKPIKGGKKIILSVTSEGNNIISGSTNYKQRDEAGKVVVEGNGHITIGKDNKASSFHYTRQQLTQDTDGETGVAIQLNTKIGQSAIVGELKLSNKEVSILNSYCEEGKDCARFNVQTKLVTAELARLDQEITVEVDLRKFNVPVEFGFKTSTKRQGLVLDHTASLYLHSSRDKSQYTYQLYVHPKESAVVLTLPTRELALVASLDIPKTKSTGAYKADISAFLDRKNNPKDKTSLAINGEVSVEKNAASFSGEARFTYPSQPKDMSVKGRFHYGGEHLLDAHLDVDVFAKKNQKIVVAAKLTNAQIPKGYNVTGSLEVISRGQQLKVDLDQHLAISASEIGFGSFLSYTDENHKPKSTGILFSVNRQEAHFLVKSPNKELIKADSIIEITKNLQKVDTEVAVFGTKPAVIKLEVKDLNSFNYIYSLKNEPNTKLVANGRVVLGQLAEVHSDSFANGAKKELFHILLHLDEGRFLKPDFGYSKDNIAKVIDLYRNRVIEISNLLKDFTKDLGEEIVSELKDLLEHLKKAQPNLKPLLHHYQAELEKLKKELHADQTIKEIQATLNKVFGGFITAVVETLKNLAERGEELQKDFAEIVTKITEAVKASYPQIKESYNKLLNAATGIFEAVVNVGVVYVKAILNVLNEHQEELKQLATIASELARDIAKIVLKAVSQIQNDVKEFVTLFIDQIKALPIYSLIQEKYQENVKLQVPETLIATIGDMVNNIKTTLPTKELQELVSDAYDYIIKHVRHEKVDEVTELKNLYVRTVNAVQSLIQLLQHQATTDDFIGLLQTSIPVNFGALSKIPGITSLKVSLLSLLRNRELPTPADLYYAYRPTLNPSDVIPPFSRTATFIDGGHFFTYDGRHLTLPGKCSYVLSQDIRDGNFSVIGTYNNGKVESITITEPTESITIKANGAILVNDRPADFPASTKNMQAFLTDVAVNVFSNYGVYLHCGLEGPAVCSLKVSGFYLGKLRGILGDGNNEPYDDFTLPSGKITEDESEFGNSYKLNSGCPNVRTVDHSSHQHQSVCTEYFTAGSPLSGCFNYVNPTPYRQACDHAVSAGTKDGACFISSAYYIACLNQRIFISVPKACGSCQVGNKQISIGDSFSVKSPKQQADVVFVIEQANENSKIYHDLITPLISVMKSELKDHGISDVRVGLIGYGDHMKWPQHYTTNGNRAIEGEIKNMDFQPRIPIVTLQEAKEGNIAQKAKFVKQRLDIELGTFRLTDAYEEAIRYPFRPGASKIVVGVIAAPCEKSPLPVSLQQLRLLVGQKVYRDLGLTYHHISTLDDITVSGKAAKNVVGFDANSAYTFGDSRRKPLEGSSEIRNNLEVTSNDVCAGFAASSGGAAFSVHNFMEAKVGQKKQFIQVAARRLVDSLVNIEIEEDCKCNQHMGIFPKADCKIVGRREKEPRSRATKGVKG